MDRRLRGTGARMTRYARQMMLPEVGPAGQERLSHAHVLVVGAGGLGCPVLQYLAGAGVGEITLVDPDVVEESNLHRQPLYRMSDIGTPKARAAAAHLQAANPGVTVHAHVCAQTPDTAPAAVGLADVVIDAADSFAVSYTLSDECLCQGKPLISASALGLAGYVGGFCGGAPSLRAVFPDLPEQAANCATAGVLGPVVGVIGALQAQMALQVLLEMTPSPLGQMLHLDLRSLQTGRFSFSDAPEPDGGMYFIGSSRVKPGDQIIELRPVDEAPSPALPGAMRLDRTQLAGTALDPQARVVLSCRTGLRAWAAGRDLQARGFSDIALFAAGAAG
jgi:molybdopterin/thiamine biosynthesis adenylyltransferase